jgi:hypothetical protein
MVEVTIMPRTVEVAAYRSNEVERNRASCSGDATDEPESARSAPADDEDTGTLDPFLDELIITDESDDQTTDEGPISGIPIGLLTDPMDLESVDEGKLGPDLAEVFNFQDATSPQGDDEEQGPSGPFPWYVVEASAETDSDDRDEGPIENQPSPLEPLQPLKAGEDRDEGPISNRRPALEIDDIDLPWSKERWAESSSQSAFSARQCLALVGTLLCVGGDATHLVGARQFDAIEDAALQAKTRRVICLDVEARRLLLLTTAGQLVLWRRNDVGIGRMWKVPVPRGEIVSMVWQLAPGVPNLLMRLENGRLFSWNDESETLVPVAQRDDKVRLRALSEIGEPRVTLWQGYNHCYLGIEVANDRRRLALTPSMERAVADRSPILAGYVDYVLLGVRGHGLFVRGQGDAEFSVIPGCRRLTAFAVGHMLGRPTAFVGLFSELEDRTEIVTVDLSTGRASRVAELCILTDDAGPEDDPPERARVDALLWDPSNLRLWAAGCFGLTCFGPPCAAVSS